MMHNRKLIEKCEHFFTFFVAENVALNATNNKLLNHISNFLNKIIYIIYYIFKYEKDILLVINNNK